MDCAPLPNVCLQEMLEKNKLKDTKLLFEHGDLTKRLRRTLYYNPFKEPDKDTLSYSATDSAVTCFRHAAPMPLGKLGHRYASKVARDACISPCALLLGMIYIERLKHANPNYLESISSSDLFLVSLMIASKYLYDEGSEDEVFNDEWANSGGVDVSKVNKLEADFLTAIDWNLYIHPHQFLFMLQKAESEIAITNGCDRGWLSYSDLRSILDYGSVCKQISQTAGLLSKVTCLCMIVYSGLLCLTAVSSIALFSAARSFSHSVTMGPHLPEHYGLQRMPVPMKESNTTRDEHPTAVSPDIDPLKLPEVLAEIVPSINPLPLGTRGNSKYVHWPRETKYPLPEKPPKNNPTWKKPKCRILLCSNATQSDIEGLIPDELSWTMSSSHRLKNLDEKYSRLFDTLNDVPTHCDCPIAKDEKKLSHDHTSPHPAVFTNTRLYHPINRPVMNCALGYLRYGKAVWEPIKWQTLKKDKLSLWKESKSHLLRSHSLQIPVVH